MSERTRKWFLQLLSVLLAVALLYLALKGVDLNRVGQDLRNGAYIWVLPLAALTIASHVLRAWRWTLMLNVLPDRGEQEPGVSVFAAFKSVMIGYMTNYAAPRLGEVVRSGHMAARSGVDFSGVFGTVVAERLLDMVCLILALFSVPLILGDRLATLLPDLLPAGFSITPSIERLAIAGLVICVVGICAFWWMKRARASPGGRSRIKEWLETFRGGVETIARTGRPAELVGSTVLIWLAYGLMAYWPFFIFSMGSTYGLGFSDAWTLMLLGSLGVVIPSPGGIGSYHYIAITALVSIWGVSQSTAASYAIFTHGGQLILYVAVGFFLLIQDGSSWKDLRRERPTAHKPSDVDH